LGLFIILYSISNVDVLKFSKMISAMGNVFGSDGKIIGLTQNQNVIDISPISKLKAGLDKVIKDNGYESSIRLEENERGITLHILEDILFASGNAELNPGSNDVLKKIAAIIRELPNDVRVEGHTDNVPIMSAAFPSNWHLSVARALNTAYYLIHDEGLSPEKVSVVGYAEYKPVAENISVTGRGQNRRVDIVIIKK
jgi:chemotaxis protein MotB